MIHRSLLEHIIPMSLPWTVRSFMTILAVGILPLLPFLRSVLPILQSLLSLAGTQDLGGGRFVANCYFLLTHRVLTHVSTLVGVLTSLRTLGYDQVLSEGSITRQGATFGMGRGGARYRSCA